MEEGYADNDTPCASFVNIQLIILSKYDAHDVPITGQSV
jgi:hypothetical protein